MCTRSFTRRVPSPPRHRRGHGICQTLTAHATARGFSSRSALRPMALGIGRPRNFACTAGERWTHSPLLRCDQSLRSWASRCPMMRASESSPKSLSIGLKITSSSSCSPRRTRGPTYSPPSTRTTLASFRMMRCISACARRSRSRRRRSQPTCSRPCGWCSTRTSRIALPSTRCPNSSGAPTTCFKSARRQFGAGSPGSRPRAPARTRTRSSPSLIER